MDTPVASEMPAALAKAEPETVMAIAFVKFVTSFAPTASDAAEVPDQDISLLCLPAGIQSFEYYEILIPPGAPRTRQYLDAQERINRRRYRVGDPSLFPSYDCEGWTEVTKRPAGFTYQIWMKEIRDEK